MDLTKVPDCIVQDNGVWHEARRLYVAGIVIIDATNPANISHFLYKTFLQFSLPVF